MIVWRKKVEKYETLSSSHGKTLLLYIFYSRIADCRSNFFFFLQQGVVESDDIDFKFVIVDKSYVPFPLVEVAKYRNVEIISQSNMGSDLCSAKDALLKLDLHMYSHYIVMNCGARGPYVKTPVERYSYWKKYISLFDNVLVRLVGALISCENNSRVQSRSHVQSWFIMFDRLSIRIALSSWKSCPWLTWRDAIIDGEVAVSRAVMQMGYKIASLQPEFYPYDKGGKCSFSGNPGMLPQDLFGQVFVKHGGELFRDDLLNVQTKIDVAKNGGSIGMENGSSDEELANFIIETELHRSCKDAGLVYLKRYKDVRENAIDPWAHYIAHGQKENRKWEGLSCKPH